jgi:type III pantothenate kinase
MINSLFSNTAQLPQIDIRDYLNFIGKDTKSSIASGILNSIISLIEKAHHYLKNNFSAEDIYIYITGGNARLIQPYIKFENKLIDDLVLAGVRSVYERNKIGK